MDYLTKEFLHQVRIAFNKETKKTFKTSYIAEALANGYGYKSYASCLSEISKNKINIDIFDKQKFIDRLMNLNVNIHANYNLISLIDIAFDKSRVYLAKELFNTIFTEIFSNITKLNISTFSITIKKDNILIRYHDDYHDPKKKIINKQLDLSEINIVRFKEFFFNITGFNELSDFFKIITFEISNYIKMKYKCKMRMVFCPINDGSLQITMRINPMYFRMLPPKRIGFPNQILESIKEKGIIFIGGLTGSGKTTSLCSIVQYLLDEQQAAIITYENITEYIFDNHKGGHIIQNNKAISEIDVRTISREQQDYLIINETRDIETLNAIIEVGKLNLSMMSTINTINIASTMKFLLKLKSSELSNFSDLDILENVKVLINQEFIADNIQGKKIAIFEYLIFNENVKSQLRKLPSNQWSMQIEKLLKEYSGKNDNFIQCESYTDTLKRFHKENRISTDCFKENLLKFQDS